MRLVKINYRELNGRQKEAFNFQKAAGKLADYGFNCLKLSDDWQGADFLAYHKDGKQTLRVQLKSRLHISEKYSGKDIYMCFPLHENWYLVKHDRLEKLVGRHTTYLTSKSWKKDGGYSTCNPNSRLLEALKPNFL